MIALGGFLQHSQMRVELLPAEPASAVDAAEHRVCLLYTSDAADERSSVDLGGRRIIKKKNSELKDRSGVMTITRRNKKDRPEHAL